ncbi:O-antigen ligase [Rubricella aquisinus]|uniref:O-antigen ligase n=1 Tax=Rubricella aquisinus TaxID=2028108 RepID=A0A840WSH8_9RHOB|nr:hypothetical protein [Rubricella aquisinus]MBB5516622.1 O-antigen ligase [Rubricella aquisinus]
MKLDTFVLIVVAVAAALMACLYIIGLMIGFAMAGPVMLFVLVPVGIAAYVIARVITERLNEAKDDPYDDVEY